MKEKKIWIINELGCTMSLNGRFFNIAINECKLPSYNVTPNFPSLVNYLSQTILTLIN